MVLIKGLQKTSIVDYPGKVSCVVFTSGCNFRCPFCQNPDLVEPNTESGSNIEEKEFLDFLDSRRKWIDGVVITGGEPCINKDLPEFAGKIKEKGFLVKLDTNGSNPDILEEMINNQLADYIAMDIKSSKENYKKATNSDVDMAAVQRSIDLIKNSGIEHEFRVTVVPTLHSEEDIRQIGEWVKGSRIILQKFSNKNTLDPEYAKIRMHSKKEIERLKELIEDGSDVDIRV